MFDVVEKIAGRVRRTAIAEAKKLGVPQDVAERVVLAAVAHSVISPGLTGDELRESFTAELNVSDDEFAVSYRQAVADKNVKEFRSDYDKAIAAGADPVEFIRVAGGITREEAENVVAELKKQSAASESIPAPREDDDGWDNVAPSPGPAPDPFAGAVQEDDRDGVRA